MTRTLFRRSIVNAILKGIEKGIPGPDAAARAGVAKVTYHRWIGDYAEFAEQVEQAESRYLGKLMEVVTDGALTDPKLALEVLSRRFPKDFARASQQDARGGVPRGPIKVTMVFDRKESGALSEAGTLPRLAEAVLEGEVVEDEDGVFDPLAGMPEGDEV